MPFSPLPLLALGLSSLSQGRDSVAIDHAPIACSVAGQYPRVDARFAPSDQVAAARVFFQGKSAEWYSVDMKVVDTGYSGVLPSPLAQLKAFRYYVEVTNRGAATSRTPEYAVDVIEGAGGCRGRASAALGTASVLVHGPAGAASLPAGFGSSGVSMAGSAAGSVAGAAGGGGTSGAAVAGGAAATGGGLSTAAIVGIAAGAVGAAGVAVGASGKDSSPTPSGTSVAGQWAGTFRDTDATPSCGTLAFSTTLVLNQSGGALTGTMTNLLTTPPPAANCAAQGTSFSGPVISGTASGTSVQFVANLTTVSPTRVFTFTGSVSGSTLSGTYVTTLPDFPQISIRGTLSATKQ
jgi:hypothetical protein